jgi:hypothetical protein
VPENFSTFALKSRRMCDDEGRVGVQAAMTPDTGSAVDESGRVTTARVAEARQSITRESVKPAESTAMRRFLDRLRGVRYGDRAPARPPYPGESVLRVVMSLLLAALCLLTVAGAVVLLLLWQQGRDSGVLTSQLDRTWDIIDSLRVVERWVAFAVVPVAMAIIALEAINVGRATGNGRNPVVAALSLPVGLIAAWLVGREWVAGSDDVLDQVAGLAVQIALLALPVIFVERIALTAEARRRPLRATYLLGAAYLAQMQFLGALSTIERADDSAEWGRLGAYLVIAGLIQVLGTLAATEAVRSIEHGIDHRYQLRSRFSESLLAQAGVA